MKERLEYFVFKDTVNIHNIEELVMRTSSRVRTAYVFYNNSWTGNTTV